MSRFSDYQPPAIVEQQKQSKFICSACGAGRDCDCKAFALKRVIEYDQANPGQSERQAAADLGIPKTTVHEARGRTRPPDDEASPTTVTGRDGKSYPRTRPRATNASPTIQQAPDIAAKMILDLYLKLAFAERSYVRDQMDRIDEEENDGAEGS
jgi:hypothetical protein